MARREPADPRASDARRDFVRSLNDLRRSAERSRRTRISLEEIAEKSGWGRTTVRAWLTGERFPDDEDKAVAVIRACAAGDPDAEHAVLETWRAARTVLDRPRSSPPSFPGGGAARGERVAPGGLPDLDLSRLEESGVVVVKFRTNSAFYSAALEKARRARSIRVTYVRQYPPTQVSSVASSDYFAGLLDWARTDPEQHQLRRIIGVPATAGVMNPAMLSWVDDHVADTADLHNYDMRIHRWTNRGDGLNMALMDDDTSFLAVSDGTRHGLWGGQISSRFVTEMLQAFYDQLWQNLETAEEFLAGLHAS